MVVAVSTANWLVITDFQKIILEGLLTGKTIGDVFPLITDIDKQNEFQRLLAAITAREFGNTNATPSTVPTSSGFNCA